MASYNIYVTSREGIFDPAGATAQRGLEQIGFAGVESLSIGKFIELKGEVTFAEVEDMCEKLLANPVIEEYRIEVLSPDSSVVTEGE